MRAIGAALAALALGCAAPGPDELRRQGEQTLAACSEHRVDTSLCLSLELIQAEYQLCLRERPGAQCDEVWGALAQLAAPAWAWRDPATRSLLSEER